MHPSLRHALWLPLVAGACASGDDGDTDAVETDVSETDVADGSGLEGVWKSTEGDAFTARGIGEVGFLSFEDVEGDAGRVVFYAREADTRALACPQAIFGLGPDGTLLLSADGGEGGGTSMYLVDQPDADTLQLGDAAGHTQTFTRVDAVDAAAACGVVTVEDDTLFDLAADGWGNLLWDGAHLLVPLDAGGVVPLDLDAGTFDAPVDYGTSYEHVQALQGTDGWGTCACGNSEEVARTSPGGAQVDLVDTRDLDASISIDAAAFDGTHLFIGGYDYDDRQTHLLEVDAEAEPDLLVSDVVSPLAGDALVFHQGALLALNGHTVVQVGDDGLAEETWQIPATYADHWWRDLGSDGTSVYVGGQPPSGVGYRVLRLTLE